MALADEAVAEMRADVMIFAGAPLAGLANKVRHRIPVPIIDPVAAAVKQAEALIALRPRKATTGSFSTPGGQDLHRHAGPTCAPDHAHRWLVSGVEGVTRHLGHS